MLLITAVAVVALVLACVAITVFAVNESDDDKNDDERKKLDEHEQRLQNL